MRVFLNDRNCKRYTGHTKFELLELSGIIGLHSHITDSMAERCAVIWTFNHVEIEIINTDIVAELLVEIYPKKKIIITKSIVKQDGKGGVGIDLLKSQVEHAFSKQYKEIHLEAYGADNNKKYIGYKTWAAFGFEMTPESLRTFRLGLNYYNQSRNQSVQADNLLSLQQLPNGNEIWELIAFDWMGVFTLDKNSDSVRIFNELLLRKNKSKLKL